MLEVIEPIAGNTLSVIICTEYSVLASSWTLNWIITVKVESMFGLIEFIHVVFTEIY